MVTVTNSFGCTVSDTLHVDVANMTVSVADDTLCDHSPHTINSSASGLFMPLSYSWWPTTGLSCTTCPAPVASATTTVSYVLTVTDTIGCTVKDTATIHRGKIDMNPMPDTTICHATGIVLAPEITGAAYPRTYNWGPATGLSCTNCATPVASPSVTTTYMVTVTNSMGCTATQSATIISNYYQLIMPRDTVVCVGLETTLSVATTTPTTQAWSPATGLDTTAGPTITTNIENDITYHVTVTDTLGCTLTDSVEVKRNTLLIYPLEGKEICEEESIALARPATFDAYPVQYSWSPAADLDCATCETPTARPTKTTTYVMVATDETGCTHTDSVTINVEMCDIWFPNAFTPNADGKNDIARVVGHLRFYTDFSLYIYNRYGEVVFHTTDITAGWNGIFKDIPADLGVYFYKINYTLNGRTHMMKGDLTLVR
jgi:gliding motility-associated-like protein